MAQGMIWFVLSCREDRAWIRVISVTGTYTQIIWDVLDAPCHAALIFVRTWS